MSLDIRGKVAAGELGVYVPIAAVACFLVFKHALRRDAGWLFLAIFSMARIAGGALVLAGQLQDRADLLLGAYILEPAALCFLLFSALGFLGMAGQHTYSEVPRMAIFFRTSGLLALVGMGLAIAGGILGSAVSPDNGNIGSILRRASACVYAGVFVLIVAGFCSTHPYRWHMRTYRRNVLLGCGAAMPFLGARMAYGIMAAWSANDLYGLELSTNAILMKMHPLTGDWIFYLVLGLIMELVTAILFLLASTLLSRGHH